ncbi:pentapeptide repeat-containing protein [Actinoplanes sp. NPDC051851]|uniref:pentapeptide repeat-containing protein n=1 Tax=Actinoplanes sp. NPDC051851 TaxID=3154753 RepID=UPI0034278415
MNVVEKCSFERLRQYGSGRVFSELDLRSVKFSSCTLSQHDDPGFGLVVRDSTLRNCAFSACVMAGVKLDNVVIEGARFSRSSVTGCAFENVTLRGKIGQLILGGPVRSLPPEMFKAFSEALVDFYRDVDWALDISDAVFSDAAIRAVPGELIRRNPERHFLIRRHNREVVLSLPDAPDLVKAYFRDFDLTPFDSMMAVAAQGSKNFEKQLVDLQWLRERGLAE